MRSSPFIILTLSFLPGATCFISSTATSTCCTDTVTEYDLFSAEPPDRCLATAAGSPQCEPTPRAEAIQLQQPMRCRALLLPTSTVPKNSLPLRCATRRSEERPTQAVHGRVPVQMWAAASAVPVQMWQQ
jgi:hypothetical protein